MKQRDPYYQSKAFCKTAIDLILECPALYKAWLEDVGERKETDAMLFGRMFHKLTLEPESFGREFAVTDLKLNTKPGMAWKKNIPAGAAIIKEADYESALQMAEAVREHPQAKYLFRNYKAEQSIYWTRDDIECKCRPDIISTIDGLNFCADLKTAESANPDDIPRTVANYHYHRQAAWYLDGLAATGTPCEAFIFIFVEKEYPFLVTVFLLDEEALEKGRSDCSRAFNLLRTCRETGEYPCYTRNIETISLPRWAV